MELFRYSPPFIYLIIYFYQYELQDFYHTFLKIQFCFVDAVSHVFQPWPSWDLAVGPRPSDISLLFFEALPYLLVLQIFWSHLFISCSGPRISHFPIEPLFFSSGFYFVLLFWFKSSIRLKMWTLGVFVTTGCHVFCVTSRDSKEIHVPIQATYIYTYLWTLLHVIIPTRII